jgi:twitching motility protein PilJ
VSFIEKFITRGRAPQNVAPDNAPTIDDYLSIADEATLKRVVTPVKSQVPDAVDTAMMEGSDSAASVQGVSSFGDTQLRTANEALVASAGDTGVPFIGRRPLPQQKVILGTLAVLGFVSMLAGVAQVMSASKNDTDLAAAVGDAKMQSQRLAKAASQALIGDPQAFKDVRDSSDTLVRTADGLVNGNEEVRAAPSSLQPDVEGLAPLVERAQRNSAAMLAQEKVLTQVGQLQRNINKQSAALLEIAEGVSSAKLQQGNAQAAEIAAAGQLVMLTQRIGKSANEVLTPAGVSAEAASVLRRDLDLFQQINDGLLKGSAELKLPAATSPVLRERLNALAQEFGTTKGDATTLLGNLGGLDSARKAHASIIADSEPLRGQLSKLQAGVKDASGGGILPSALTLLGMLGLVAGSASLLSLGRRDQTQRALQAEADRLRAERQEKQAKLVNDSNQAAILRLMNELQTVAEGDLTQQATVTEDITGAIADSVNYTVEELRTLVAQVQGTVGRVTETTQQVEQTSTELLAASTEQLREIRETGEAVLQMADRINDVSSQAQQSAQVAEQSLGAADRGLRAVQDTIDGMNAMRDQIQDTSKRIKRLGESSQEIGEITELISDITDQTNVLALNAAIQAASAGEAGRGFSVVAEEVQRLAERSGDATRQIASLVKAIQTDTQDAVAAMERSTQNVVASTRLSDAAGTALGDIDRVTRQLSELIARISNQASQEAKQANVVAANIQHIFAVTEQTGEGTRSTADIVRELSRTAEELKQSVARFKIA